MQAYWVVGGIFVFIATFGTAHNIIFKYRRIIARKDRQLQAVIRDKRLFEREKKMILDAYLSRVEQLRHGLVDRIRNSGAEGALLSQSIDVAKLKNALLAASAAGNATMTCELLGKALDRTLELWRASEPTLVCCEYVRMFDEDLASRVASAKATLASSQVPENFVSGFRVLPALIESVENRRRAAVAQLQSAEIGSFGSIVLELDAAAAAMRHIEVVIRRVQSPEPTESDGP